MRKSIAEFIGTFALVFCGTGAIVINQEMGGGDHASWDCHYFWINYTGYDLRLR